MYRLLICLLSVLILSACNNHPTTKNTTENIEQTQNEIIQTNIPDFSNTHIQILEPLDDFNFDFSVIDEQPHVEILLSCDDDTINSEDLVYDKDGECIDAVMIFEEG